MEMKKKGGTLAVVLIVFAIIIAILLILGLWVAGTYNGLIKTDVNTANSWAKVQTAYERRADLIPNLVSTVKAYSNYEGATQTQIAAFRSGIQNAKTPGQLDSVGKDMNSLISNLIVSVEAYPDLKANQNYLALQDELAGTENRIKFERDNYNDGVKVYQTLVRTFPTNIIANIFGFEVDKWEMFAANAGAENAPIVNFSN